MATMTETANMPHLNNVDADTLAETRESYERDGATVLRNVVPVQWLEALREGTERLMRSAAPDEDLSRPGEGRFFGDLFAYLRVPEYRDFIMNSGVGKLAAEIMGAKTARFFYDQPLIKEPGTPKPTPWHQDSAYWPCSGHQVMSVWVPLDPASPESGVVSYVKGSHKWNAYYPTVNWSDREEVDFGQEPGNRDLSENPGPGATASQPRTIADIRDHPENYDIVSWNVEPGDVLIHHMDTMHGAPGNMTQDRRRRAVALRFLGDDARWDDSRPHFMRIMKRQAPDFPYPKHQTGDLITDPLFPVVWQQ